MESKIFTLACFRKILFASLLLIFNLLLFSQNYQSYFWYMGDKEINMSNYSSPTVNTIAGNPPHAFYAASGAYYIGSNSAPATEFTVSDNYAYQYDIVNGLAQQQLFDLNANYTSNPPEVTTTGTTGPEIIAIPKPGSECGVYYIIWSSYNTSASATFQKTATLGYSQYTTDLNTAVVNNTLNTCQIINTTYYGEPFPPSIAVGKKLANGNRYLYAVVPFYDLSQSFNVTTRLYKYSITSTGITQVDLTPGIINDYIEFLGIIQPSETELSFDQSMIAFARKNTTAFPNEGQSNAIDMVIVKLDPSTGNLLGGSMANVITYNLPDNIQLH